MMFEADARGRFKETAAREKLLVSTILVKTTIA